MHSAIAIAFILLIIPAASHAADVKPLDDPHKKIVKLTPKDNLSNKVGAAQPGTTLLLENGTYRITRALVIRKPDVWIRSASGKRENVILDGLKPGKPVKPLRRDNCVNEIIAVRASNVTIADITIRYARDHGIHIYPAADGNVENTVMHNIHIYDCGQQLIKVNSNGGKPRLYWTDRGILEDSVVEFQDNAIMQKTGNGFYTGGLDVHGGRDWIIRRCIFKNIQREGKIMEHAIHMWSSCRGTLVEQNTFIDCLRAVGFGMKTKPRGHVRSYADGKGKDPYFDHVDGVVRNNIIFNRKGIHLETGIELMNVIDVKVYHNTVVSQDKAFSSIEYRWPNTRVEIMNNIVSQTVMRRNGAKGVIKSNIEHAKPGLFKNYTNGDLHLSPNATQAIDKAIPGKLPEPVVDVDGEKRDAKPDIGADEVVD